MHLVLRMTPKRTGNQWKGVLLLFLILVAFHFLKLSSGHPKSFAFARRAGFLIEVGGDVRHPGVYAFGRQPDIAALIEAAGRPDSWTGSPMATDRRRLISGSKVTIISLGERSKVSFGRMSAFFKITLGIPISLNRETQEGFTAIPGIGAALAHAIVEERSRRKRFRDIRELTEVQGIGPKLYKKIRPYLVL